MRLPKTWTKISAGHYLHLETGVEILHDPRERENGEWGVLFPHHSGAHRTVHAVASASTMTEAASAADARWIPAMRDQISACWNDAHFHLIGHPHEWPLGQADESTVVARRVAVRQAGTPTGASARPGDLVVDIETGQPGVFETREIRALCFVRFAGEAEPAKVCSSDVAVITYDWLPCNQWSDEPGHEDHGAAVTGECLLPKRDQDLVGPELKWISRGYWVAEDGVELFRAADGTFSAWRPTPHGRESICSSQPRKTCTNRMINAWRAELPGKIDEAHEAALNIVATQTVIDETHLELARADVAYEAAITAQLPGNYEAGQIQQIKERLARAQLKLTHLQGRPYGYTRIVVSERREGTTWKPLFVGLSEANTCESAAAQAERYAAMNYFRGRAYRLRIYSDPAATTPDAEWTNVPDQVCRPGQHTRADRIMPGARRSDGSLIEAATCATCIEPLWRVAPLDSEPYPWLLEGEELPPAAPGVIYLSLVQITTKHYGMQINDGLGGWHVLEGVGAFDPDSGDVPVSVEGVTVPMPGGTMVQLRPAPPAPADPGLDDDYLDPTRPQTPNLDLNRPGESITEDGSGVGAGEIRYRVQTRTRPGDPWRIAQTGTAPTGLQADLAVVAQTVIGNAGPILGLRPDQTFPGLLVQTWRWPTGQTATATVAIPDRLERSDPTQ